MFGTKETKPTIYIHQEIELEKGKTKEMYIDIGHVLCGMDAFNNPDKVIPPNIEGWQPTDWEITHNIDAVTWLGDLASVLGDSVMEAIIKKRNLTEAEIQNIIDADAPNQDMLGNIDAYVIAKSYNINGNKLRVSDLFKDYYLGKGVEKFQNRRYHLFAESLGLGTFDGKKFKNEDEKLKLYTDEINDAAAFYILAGAKAVSNINAIKSLPLAINVASNNFSKTLFIALLESLKNLINKK